MFYNSLIILYIISILSFDKLIKNKLSTGRERDELDVKLLQKRKKS